MSASKRRVSITSKLVLVATTYVLPIGVLLYLFVGSINEFINFAEAERKGDAYQRPLEGLLDGVERHQILVHGGATPAEVQAVSAKVDRAFTALEGEDERLGVDLQFTEEGLQKRDRSQCKVKIVKEQWQAITAELAKVKDARKLPEDLDTRYGKLVTDIRTMITHCGDTSNLILDPDLDSYYLMDVTLLGLPQVQERTARVVLYGREVLARGVATREEQMQLVVHAAMLESDLDRITASVQTSLNEDANFYGDSPTLKEKLPPAVAAYKEALTRFIQMTRQVSDPSAPKVTEAEYVAAGLKAHDESFQLWTVGVGELDVLLDKRIDHYTTRRTRSLTLASLAVLVASVLALLVTLSIIRPLTALVRRLGPGATLLASSVNRIAEASQRGTATSEEAAIICEELNAHADEMRMSVGELESLVHGHPVTQLEPAPKQEVLAHA